MSYLSTNSDEFTGTVKNWFSEKSELLVLFRFSASAGCQSWEFFSDFEELKARIKELPPKTCLCVFRENELKLRGQVSKEFVKSAFRLFNKDSEWLIMCLERTRIGKAEYYDYQLIGTTEELTEELVVDYEYYEGKMVAFGPMPEWLEDRDGLICAINSESKELVEPGIY